MEIKNYKTLKGLIRNTWNNQISADHLFREDNIEHKNNHLYQLKISDELRRNAARLLSSYCVKNKGRASDMAYSLIEGYGDISLFQGFFFSLDRKGEVYVSNNLSGSAFNYCIRKYLKESC